ncbi:MAG: hypothetical protein SPJ13_07740, partial [Bacteroidales bacterium]|nr:hypothetical protein [Bacteroidales bacterium]
STAGKADEKQLKKIERYMSAKTMEQYRTGTASLEDVKKEVAHTLFIKAAEYDREQYNANRSLFNATGQNNYQILDIAELRKIVQPIQR